MLHWYDRVWAWILTFWYWLVIGALVAIALWGWLRPSQVRVEAKVVKETVVVEKEKVFTATPPVQTSTPAPTSAPMPMPTPMALITVRASSPVTATVQVTGTRQITATPVVTQGAWAISYFPGATQEMRGWKFQDPAPKSWPMFPNVPNGNIPALLEYGKTIDEFCQQGQVCDVVVSAMHYRIISGDYNLPDVAENCQSGCAIMLVNVGNVTASFRNQSVDAGWTVTGRYWDGSKMPDTICAGLSHTGYNMLNLAGNVNPGANCGSPSGCPKVRLTFVIISGNEVLMKGTSIVSR